MSIQPHTPALESVATLSPAAPAANSPFHADARSTLLLVADDPIELDGLRNEIEHQAHPPAVFTAVGGEEALRALEIQPVDLLVTDLVMPGLDGLGLLRSLQEQHFRGSSVVMGDRLTPELELELRHLGALACLPKPVPTERLLGLCRRILGGSHGELRGFSTPGIAQLIQLEGKSCLLRIRQGEHQGDLVFSRGQLINAWTADANGEDAALAILAWQSADVHVYDLLPSEQTKLRRPLSDLILEAARLYDEQVRDSWDDGDWDDGLGSWAEEESPSRVAVPDDLEEMPKRVADRIDDALRQLLAIDGARRVALVDLEQGRLVRVAARGSADDRDADYDFHSPWAFDPESRVEDVLTTLSDRYHLVRPLHSCRRLSLHLALDRAGSILALARHCLAEIEAELCAE